MIKTLCDVDVDLLSHPIHIPRSWRSVWPHLLIAVFVAGLALYLEMQHGLSRFRPSMHVTLFGKDVTLQFPIFLLLILFLCARPLLLMKDCFHEIGRNHLRSVVGRCSIKRTKIEIPFEDILGVRVNQSPLERMLMVGTIIAWTASADRPDITMKGIGKPDYFASLITRHIDVTRQKSGHGSGNISGTNH